MIGVDSREYKILNGKQVKWDFENQYDVPFGEEFEAGQGKTEYKEPIYIASDERLNRLAEIILKEGIEEGASDIQLVPKKNYGLVRLRIDDRMVTHRVIHKGAMYGLSIVLRKMAGLQLGNLSEATIDGHVYFQHLGDHYDFRVATSPTQFGHLMDLRLLSSANLSGDISKLGLPDVIVSTFRRLTKQKEGLILLVGGTGSGKSTTLATGMIEVNNYFDKELNIMTIENPVEYVIEDIVQSSVNELAGFTFVKALQTMLRQNPDQILVGEVNNSETAGVMARAAGTGHLVYSTLHANSVLEVHDALHHYGLTDRDILQTLRVVVYQSLEPRLCEHCKLRRIVTPTEKDWLDKYLLRTSSIAVVHEANHDGCEHCERGYKGRVLIAEMLESNREYRMLYEELKRTSAGQDDLKHGLLTTEGINFYPIEYDVYRHLKEGTISLDTAYKLIAG